jgi:hypothetical protein
MLLTHCQLYTADFVFCSCCHFAAAVAAAASLCQGSEQEEEEKEAEEEKPKAKPAAKGKAAANGKAKVRPCSSKQQRGNVAPAASCQHTMHFSSGCLW